MSCFNHFVSWEHLGTYHEFLSLLDKAGCEVHSTSPVWSLADHYLWYKNVLSPQERHQRFLEDFHQAFPFFLIGLPHPSEGTKPATDQEIEAVSDFIKSLSLYNFSGQPFESITYPALMDGYLGRSQRPELHVLNTEIKGLLEVLKNSPEQGAVYYKKTNYLRKSMGSTLAWSLYRFLVRNKALLKFLC